MFQISIAQVSVIIGIIVAVFTFGRYMWSKQDKSKCQEHNQRLADFNVLLTQLATRLEGTMSNFQVQMDGFQRQLDSVREQIDIAGRIDRLEELLTCK